MRKWGVAASRPVVSGATLFPPAIQMTERAQRTNFGKVRTCRGVDVNPNPDADGIHVRLSTPGFATAWLIANDEPCPSDAVFDGRASRVQLHNRPRSARRRRNNSEVPQRALPPPAGGRARLVDTMVGAV